MMSFWRWILRLLPWGVRNLGKYEKWKKADGLSKALGGDWVCYRFLDDCDCAGKNYLSGSYRVQGTLKIRGWFRSWFGLGRPQLWDVELEGWGWELGIETNHMTVPLAVQYAARRRINILMRSVVVDKETLNDEERWVVNQDIAYALERKRYYAAQLRETRDVK